MQLDIYSDAAGAYDAHIALSGEVRSALEKIGGQLSSAGSAVEPDTQLYRTRLDFKLWDESA
jgi:hypothetical protein